MSIRENTTSLEEILSAVNALPDAGGGGGGTFTSVSLTAITASYADRVLTLSGIDTDGLVSIFIFASGMKTYILGANGSHGTLVNVLADVKSGVCAHTTVGLMGGEVTVTGVNTAWTAAVADGTTVTITSTGDNPLAGFATDIGTEGIYGLAVYCK